MKILIGYDGSECAETAIEDLARAGLPAENEALVLSVADVYPHLPPETFEPLTDARRAQLGPVARRAHEVAAAGLADARELAAAGASKVASRFPRWKITPEARGGNPAAVILDAADKYKPDLIIVGSQGRSAIARAMLGSVSQKVLAYAHCSVRIARTGPTPRPPSVRLIVGIDGSPDAALAVSAVAARVWPAGTEARVVTAIDNSLSTVLPAIDAQLGQWVTAADNDPLQWTRRAADASAQELTAAGLHATSRLPDGDPKRVLVEEAESFHADCIFLGARGLGRIEQFLLGSVSSSVAARAKCSVEVIRSGAT